MSDISLKQPYAPSTVALTMYNILADLGRPADLAELLDACRAQQHPEAEFDLAVQAAKGLLDRGYVRMKNGKIRLKDTCRLHVLERDRSDGYEMDDEGNLSGGWNGWMLGAYHGGPLVRIEEVLN